MSRVLVTGITGFTGRYLSSALAAAGHQVHGLTHREAETAVESASSVRVCDLNDARQLDEVFAEIAPDKVVHLAAIAFVAHDDVDAIYRTNIVGTRHLLASAAKADGLQAVVVASSANVYGNRREGSLDETMPPGPANDYAVSKLAMEHVAQLYSERLPIIIARPFNYTGVGQDRSFVIPKIIGKVREREPSIDLGLLDVARDFSDVRDVVAAYMALLEEPRAIGGKFNICSGNAYSLTEVLDLIRALSGHDIKVEMNPALVRENEVKVLRGNREKLETLTGVRPVYRLADTIEWMLNAS